MNKALDNDCFFSALSLALTLPDICGKAKYPTDGNKKRYIAWYDEYVGAYEQCPGEEGEMPYLSGEVVYQLRCSFLHQGNPNIDKGKINEECCKIDKFVLLTEKKKEFKWLPNAMLEWGRLIQKERDLITGVKKADRKRFKEKFKEYEDNSIPAN